MRCIIVLLTIFIVPFFVCNGQKRYFTFINKAETGIIDSKYKLSLRNYQRAFRTSKRVFAKDLYNAACCSNLLGRNKLAKKYILKLSLKGVEVSFFERNKQMQIYFNDEVFNQLYKSQLNDFHNTLKNQELIKKIDSIYTKDQYYRKLSFTQEGFKGPLRDSIFITDKTNAIAFKKVIDEFSFPSEDLVGVSPVSYPRGVIPNLENYLLIIWHQTKTNLTINFKKDMLKAVLDYKLTPHNAAFLIGLQEGQDIYGIDKGLLLVQTSDEIKRILPDSILKKTGKWVFRNISKQQEETINQARKSIGLETLGEYRRKLFYAYKNPNTLFLLKPQGGATTYMMNDAKSIISWLKYTTILE